MQSGVRSYFERYRENVGVPLFLYGNPDHARTIVQPEMIEQLIDDGSVVGMKACNNDIGHFLHTAAYVGSARCGGALMARSDIGSAMATRI